MRLYFMSVFRGCFYRMKSTLYGFDTLCVWVTEHPEFVKRRSQTKTRAAVSQCELATETPL